jgi:hypothetical protein
MEMEVHVLALVESSRDGHTCQLCSVADQLEVLQDQTSSCGVWPARACLNCKLARLAMPCMQQACKYMHASAWMHAAKVATP